MTETDTRRHPGRATTSTARWVAGRVGETFESRDPATGELVAVAPRPASEDVGPGDRRGPRDVRRRRLAGHVGHASGRRSCSSSPGCCARRPSRSPRLVAIEMGKPIRYVREREIEPAIDRILFYASAARMIRGEVTASAPEPPAQPHPQGAGRRVRADHAVERPGRPAAAQDRRGDRDRLHVRAQAGQRRAGVVDGDLRAARPDRGAAAGRRERRRRAGRGRRRGARRPTRGSTRSASPAAARSAGG